VSVEDGYVKGLMKLQKNVSHVPESSLGAFTPMWQVLKEMCEKLSTLHSQFVQMLMDLAREISEYNITQKDKLKNNMKGEIDSAQDALQTLEGMDSQLHKSKKLYQQSCDQVNKLHGKLKKARADPAAPKAKQQLESRVKQAESWMESMKSDHQSVVRRHCDQLMEFQGKMTEACQKFESLEEEHIAQMVTFMYNISQVGPSCECVSSWGTEYVVQTEPLFATDPGNPQWTGGGGVLRSACSAGLTLCGETAEGLCGSQGNRHRKTQTFQV